MSSNGDDPRRISRANRVFSYSADHAPCARIEPGERIIVETTNAFGDQKLEPGDTLDQLDFDACDPLTGPLFVEGAEPGDSIAVHIEHIELIGTGVQGIIADFGILEWDRLPLHFFTPENGRIRWLRGIEIDVRPNLGAMGVAPASGSVPSIEPGDHGGNQDAKHVCAGSAVHFPVFHPGALFYTGDPHSAQGDGEVSGTAIEHSLTGIFRFIVHKKTAIKGPRAEDADYYIMMGIDFDLDRAMRLAVQEVVTFLISEKGLQPGYAYSLASIAVDFHVAEAVDQTQVVTGKIPKSIFKKVKKN